MYMCRLCSKSKDFDEEAFFTASGRGLDLNSTETTQLMNETSAVRAGTSGTNVELVNVRRKVEQYEQNHEKNGAIEAAHNVPRLPPQQPLSSSRDHGVKPPVAQRPIVKPPIANKPGGSVTKPSNLPPPPPPAAQNNVQTATVVLQHQQKTVVLKPKSAPPPPPPQENTDGYRTKKRSAPQPPQAALRLSSGHESPPAYDDVMLDIPVDDYLTDNDN